MTPPQKSALRDAALAAAARGWHVHPLRPGGKASALHGQALCPCTGPCAGGHVKFEQRATTDPERIRRTWDTGPYNVGIAPGPSNLVVIDLDVPKPRAGEGCSDAPGGAENFAALCERAAVPWPATYTVRTPSGGHHLYFSLPPTWRLPSTAGTLAPFIDTRAWGGNIVAAGSTTPHGIYEATCDGPAAELPIWLWHLLMQPDRTAVRAASPAPLLIPGGTSRRAAVALECETARVRNAPEGQRHALLLRRTIVIGRFIVWGEITQAVVEEAFAAAGEAAGLPATEVRATIRDALDYSARTCRARETA
ncbi:bifunctional DNA primase/polymerase [Streptomyces sp. O3]